MPTAHCWFGSTLPALQSDLAQQVTKKPYVFNFFSMTEAYNEKELEDALVANVTKFLVELGIPTEIKSTLPSIEEIESRLEQLSENEDEIK